MNTGPKTGKGRVYNTSPLPFEEIKPKELAHLENLDWVQKMKACPQDPEWHAEGDVWTHTKMVLGALVSFDEYQKLNETQKKVLSIATLLHDISKPEYTKVEEGRIISPKHAKIGEHRVRELLWDFPIAYREEIAALVRLHGFPIWAIDKKQVHKLILKHALRIDLHLLYLLAKADVIGRIGSRQQEMLDRIEYFKELAEEMNCYRQQPQFYNDHSRFKYFQGEDDYPSSIYDDTAFNITLLCGIAGSGKDTYTNTLDVPIVSLDTIREKLGIPHQDKKGQGKVIQQALEEAKQYCRKKQSFIWNATSLTQEQRAKIKQLALTYGGQLHMVYVESDMDSIVSRRKDEIPADKLYQMRRRLEMPTLDEAYSIIYLRN
ncbi:AAA family ATPase [Algivirga pacifica]